MAVLLAPRPTPVEKRPFKFTVVKEFLDLERLLGDGRCAIRTNGDYLKPDLQPFSGKDGHKRALKALVNNNGGKESCRLVYITRHAESNHNVKSMKLGKKESFAAADHFDKEKDPSLSSTGVDQAKQLGARIANSQASEFGLPNQVHCSPLWRCVQTAGYVGANYHAPQPLSALNVKLSDKWREWKGPGQLHVSDGRSTKTILNGRIRTLNGTVGAVQMKVDFEENFTDIDEAFHDPETFINVDIRVEHAFAELFEGDANCRHIVTHGRTSQSLLRVLGFERKRREANLEDYRIWDFENAGTIVLLIRRQLRNDQCEQVKRDSKLQQEELQYINREYERDINDGFESIQQCAAKVSDKRDTWMAKLDMLQEEMQENKSVAWRHELLQKALNGTFRHGEFIVSYGHGFN